VTAEIYRVLRTGGWIFVSVPSLALRDADEESWRFLPARCGFWLSFRGVEMVPAGGGVAGLSRTMNSGLSVLVWYPRLRTIFRWTVSVDQSEWSLLDRVAPSKVE